MSFPLKPVTNSSAAASNSTALTSTLPIIGVNSSQVALATIAPSAPTVEPQSLLQTNLTTALFQGYSPATSWDHVAMNTSPSTTQAGRRAQTSGTDGEESSAPLVRRRAKRSETATKVSTPSTTNSTAKPLDQHIGKIMCGGNETHPIVKDDFTFTNVFPDKSYTGDDAVERCAELAFDPRFKDCEEGVRRVCEALIKHLDIVSSNKISPAAHALMKFMQNITESSFNHKELIDATRKKRFTEKKDEDSYFYFPPGNENNYYGKLTGTNIKISNDNSDADNVGISKAIIINSHLNNITFTADKLTLDSGGGNLQLNNTRANTKLDLNNLRFENKHLTNNNGEPVDKSTDLYSVFFDKEKKIYNATAEVAIPINISNSTIFGQVIESHFANAIVTGATENNNITINSGSVSGAINGTLQTGKISQPGMVEEFTISSSEDLLKKSLTLQEIIRDIGLEVSTGEIRNPAKIILKDSFNITQSHSVTNKADFANNVNFTIPENNATLVNASDYSEVQISGKLTIESGVLDLEKNKIASVTINCELSSDNSKNISTDATGNLSGVQGCLLIPKPANSSAQYHYTLDSLKNVDIELGQDTNITDLQLVLNKIQSISRVNLKEVNLSNATLTNACFTANSLTSNRTISDGEKEFIRVNRPIKLDNIPELRTFNLTLGTIKDASVSAKKESSDGRKAEASFTPKLAKFLNQKTTWQPPQQQQMPAWLTRFLNFLYEQLSPYAKFTVFFIGAASGAVLALTIGSGITWAIFHRARRDELRAQIYHREQRRALQVTDTTEVTLQNLDTDSNSKSSSDFNPEKYVDEAINKKRKKQQANIPNLETQLEHLAALGADAPESDELLERLERLAAQTDEDVEQNEQLTEAEEVNTDEKAQAAGSELTVEVPEAFIEALLEGLQLREFQQIEQGQLTNEIAIQTEESDLYDFEQRASGDRKYPPLKEKYLKQAKIFDEKNEKVLKTVLVSVADEASPQTLCKEWLDKLSKDLIDALTQKNKALTPKKESAIACKEDDIELQSLLNPKDVWAKEFLQLNEKAPAAAPIESIEMADESGTGSSQTTAPDTAPQALGAAIASTAATSVTQTGQRTAAGGAGEPDDDDPDQNKKQSDKIKNQCERDDLIGPKQKKEGVDEAVNMPEEEKNEDGNGAAAQLKVQEEEGVFPEYHEQYIDERSGLSDKLGNIQKEISKKEEALKKLQIEKLEKQLEYYNEQGVVMPTDLATATPAQKLLHAADALLQQKMTQQLALIKEIKSAQQQEKLLIQQENIASCQHFLVQGRHQYLLAARRNNVTQRALSQSHVPQAVHNALLASNFLAESTFDNQQLVATSQAVLAEVAQNETVQQRVTKEQFLDSVTALKDSQADVGYLSGALGLADQLALLQFSSKKIINACSLSSQAEQSEEQTNATLAALKALQLSRDFFPQLAQMLEQVSTQSSLSSTLRLKWRELYKKQTSALEKLQQELNLALPKLSAAQSALALPEVKQKIASCTKACDGFSKEVQKLIAEATAELSGRLVSVPLRELTTKRHMEQMWLLGATTGCYLGELESHTTHCKALLPLFLNNGHADESGKVDAPFSQAQRLLLIEKINHEQQEFIRLARQTQVELAASYNSSLIDQTQFNNALNELQITTSQITPELKKYHETLLTLELDEMRSPGFEQELTQTNNALKEVSKLLEEAQSTQKQAQVSGSKNLVALNDAVAGLTNYRNKLQEEVEGARKAAENFAKRFALVKREYQQANEQACSTADALVVKQRAVIAVLNQQERKCYDDYLTAKQALTHQPLCADLSLEERKKLANSVSNAITRTIDNAKLCYENGVPFVEQLELIGQSSHYHLFLEQSKDAAAETEHWLERFASDVEEFRTHQAVILESGQWPDKLVESINYDRLRMQQALQEFVEPLQRYLEAQELRLKTSFAKLNANKLALDEYNAESSNGQLTNLITVLDNILTFDAVNNWKTLPQIKLFKLRDSCQEAYGKLSEQQQLPDVKQNQHLQCLLQKTVDNLDCLWRYVERALNGASIYAGLTASFEESESKLHALYMLLREKNPKLDPSKLSPVYYGRGIRDYFAKQHLQRLEQVQERQASESEKLQDAALKLYGTYKMGAQAETQELLKWQTDDKQKIAAAAKKPSEPIEATLGRIEAMLRWDNTKAASKALLQENREKLTEALTAALVDELQTLTQELEYRAFKHHRITEKAVSRAQIDRQKEAELARRNRLAQIPHELAALAQQITPAQLPDDENLGTTSRSSTIPSPAGSAIKKASSNEIALFAALEREQQRLSSEQKEYEDPKRRGLLSKAALDAPADAYKAAVYEQAKRYLIGGGISAAEKAQLVSQLIQTLQPILDKAAHQGALFQTSQTELHKRALARWIRWEDEPKNVQEAAELDVADLEDFQRLKFIGQSGTVNLSLIEQAAQRIASTMAKRVSLNVKDSVLEPMTKAVVDTLQAALQEKYGLLLEEKVEKKAKTERVEGIKFKSEKYEKALMAQRPELALMAESRYELEQKRDAKAQILRQQLQTKLAKFDEEVSQLKKEQENYAKDGKEKKSQALLKRINKMNLGRMDVEAEIQKDHAIKAFNKEIDAITKAMEKRAFSIPTLSLQQDAILRSQQLADQLRGAAAAEEPALAELHAVSDPELAQARLHNEPAQASKEFDNAKIKFARS